MTMIILILGVCNRIILRVRPCGSVLPYCLHDVLVPATINVPKMGELRCIYTIATKQNANRSWSAICDGKITNTCYTHAKKVRAALGATRSTLGKTPLYSEASPSCIIKKERECVCTGIKYTSRGPSNRT